MGPLPNKPRRFLVPVVMWVLFVACVAGAYLLVRFKSGLWRVDLAAASFGVVDLKLPNGWRVTHRDLPDGSVSIQAQETAPPKRSLTIQCTEPDATNSPLSYLMGSGLFQLMTLDPDDVRQFEEIHVSDGEGIIIHPSHSRASFAILTFDDGRAVTVQMTHRGSSTASDDAILYHVATSVRLKPIGERPAKRSVGGREI